MTVLQGEGVSRGVASGKLRFLRRDARAQPAARWPTQRLR